MQNGTTAPRSPEESADARDLQRSCERIEQLLAEISTLASPPAVKKVDTVVRLIVDLYGAGLARIVGIMGESRSPEEIRTRVTQDEVVAALLILHGLHPQDVDTRIRTALEGVRPYLGSHGGDIELVGVDAQARVVRLRMKGSCDGCPSSAITLKLAVEGAIKAAAPEIEHIEVDGIMEPAPRTNGNAGAAGNVSWVELVELAELSPGETTRRTVNGAPIVLCRIDSRLYAYGDGCPSCGSFMARALEGTLLRCPSCDRRYDARGAGRSTEESGLHLAPVPLLEDAAGVRVAVAEAHP